MRLRRLVAIAIALLLATQLGAAEAAAIYTGSCDDAQFGGLKYTNERTKSNPGITGVIIELDARMLVPCTPGIIPGSFSAAVGSLQSTLQNTNADRSDWTPALYQSLEMRRRGPDTFRRRSQ